MEITRLIIFCFIIGIIFGIILGALIISIIHSAYSCGDLIIMDDPESGLYMFLQISRHDEKYIREKKYIKLRVVNKGTH